MSLSPFKRLLIHVSLSFISLVILDDNLSNLLALPDKLNGLVRLVKRPHRVENILKCHLSSRDGSHQLVLVVFGAGVDSSDVQPPVDDGRDKLLEMFGLRSTEVADLADDTTAACALHALNEGAAATVLDYEIDTDISCQAEHLLLPLGVCSVVDGLDLGLAKLLLDLLKLLVAGRRQDDPETRGAGQLEGKGGNTASTLELSMSVFLIDGLLGTHPGLEQSGRW